MRFGSFGHSFSKGSLWTQKPLGWGGRIALAAIVIPLALTLLPILIFVALSQRKQFQNQKTQRPTPARNAFVVDLEPENFSRKTKSPLPPRGE